jgi:hypothetical protein
MIFFMLRNIKKILVMLLLSMAFLSVGPVFSETDCTYKGDGTSIWDNLNNCLNGSALVNWENAKVEDWLKENINTWVGALATFLWIFAVWSIVYGALLMTLSAWDEEKIKKAKEVVKWWMIGFVCVLWASAVILLVVNIMFSIWK